MGERVRDLLTGACTSNALCRGMGAAVQIPPPPGVQARAAAPAMGMGPKRIAGGAAGVVRGCGGFGVALLGPQSCGSSLLPCSSSQMQPWGRVSWLFPSSLL